MEKIIHLTDDNFQESILKNKKLILIDFWAEWCNPCKIISPILDEIAKEYYDKICIMKLNVEKNSTIPSKYNIRSIPTLLLFKNGNLIDKKIGLISKTELIKFLEKKI